MDNCDLRMTQARFLGGAALYMLITSQVTDCSAIHSLDSVVFTFVFYTARVSSENRVESKVRNVGCDV